MKKLDIQKNCASLNIYISKSEIRKILRESKQIFVFVYNPINLKCPN